MAPLPLILLLPTVDPGRWAVCIGVLNLSWGSGVKTLLLQMFTAQLIPNSTIMKKEINPLEKAALLGLKAGASTALDSLGHHKDLALSTLSNAAPANETIILEVPIDALLVESIGGSLLIDYLIPKVFVMMPPSAVVFTTVIFTGSALAVLGPPLAGGIIMNQGLQAALFLCLDPCSYGT